MSLARVGRLAVLPIVATYAAIRMARRRADRRSEADLWAEAVSAAGLADLGRPGTRPDAPATGTDSGT